MLQSLTRIWAQCAFVIGFGLIGAFLISLFRPDFMALGFWFTALCAAFFFYRHSWLYKVPPIPMPDAVQRGIIAEIPVGDSTICELGSGFGGTAIALARALPNRQIVGIEISPVPFLIGYLRAKLSGLSNLKMIFDDFLQSDLGFAPVLTSYLYPPLMTPLGDKLREGGAAHILLNVNFPIISETPQKIITVPRQGEMADQIFIYEFGNN